MSGSPKDDEQVAVAGVLQVVGHVQVVVHPCFQHWDAAEPFELGGVGVVVEGAGNQQVEPGFRGLAGGLDEVGAGDGAELRADEHGGAALVGRGFLTTDAAFGADAVARPARQGREIDAGLPCGPVARRRSPDCRGWPWHEVVAPAVAARLPRQCLR